MLPFRVPFSMLNAACSLPHNTFDSLTMWPFPPVGPGSSAGRAQPWIRLGSNNWKQKFKGVDFGKESSGKKVCTCSTKQEAMDFFFLGGGVSGRPKSLLIHQNLPSVSGAKGEHPLSLENGMVNSNFETKFSLLHGATIGWTRVEIMETTLAEPESGSWVQESINCLNVVFLAEQAERTKLRTTPPPAAAEPM